jgi:hypothetical protein
MITQIFCSICEIEFDVDRREAGSQVAETGGRRMIQFTDEQIREGTKLYMEEITPTLLLLHRMIQERRARWRRVLRRKIDEASYS